MKRPCDKELIVAVSQQETEALHPTAFKELNVGRNHVILETDSSLVEPQIREPNPGPHLDCRDLAKSCPDF